MTYAPVNGLQLYYEIHGSGRPLVLLHGGLLTIDLSFGPLLEPLAAGRQVIAVELQGHGRTADTGRPMTIGALAGDVVVLLDHLGIAEADLFGFSLGGLVAFAVALGAPARVGKLIVASADAHRPPGRESAPPGDDRLPTPADFQAWRDAYDAVAPDPAHVDEFAARASAMVHEFPGWTGELRSLQVPALLIGRRRQGGRRRRPPADRGGVRGRAVPPAPGSRGTGRRTGPDHGPGRRRPGPPRRGRLRPLPRQPARPGRRPRSGTPPHYRERGWSWPPRLAAESFISYGVFADPAQARPRARLSGTVLKAGHHVCALTGQPFTVAAVRTAGFEADLCLAGSEHPGLPAPGNIISLGFLLSRC